MVKSAGLSEKLWLWCFVFTALIMFSVWKLLLLVWRHSVFSPTPLMLLHFISLCQHHPTHSQVYVWGLLSSALWKDRKERKKWDVSVAVNNNITTRTQLKWDECRRWTWKHFFPYYSFTSCCHYCVKHHSGNWFFPVGAKQAGGGNHHYLWCLFSIFDTCIQQRSSSWNWNTRLCVWLADLRITSAEQTTSFFRAHYPLLRHTISLFKN